MPETTYHRISLRSSTETGHLRVGSESQDLEKKVDIEVYRVDSLGALQPQLTAAEPRRKTFLEGLAIFNHDVIAGADKSSFAYLLVRPFIACLTPVCFWASLLYGFGVTWLEVVAFAVSQIFEARRESLSSLADHQIDS